MTISKLCKLAPLLAMSLLVPAAPASAQDVEPDRLRTRIALGPQLVPSYPGADGVSLRPLIDVSRARGEAPFAFEAPDESFGFPVYRSNGFSIGPSLGFEGKRGSDDVGTPLPAVGFTLEVGAFAQYQLSDTIRLRAEARQGVTGHEGFISMLSADYVTRAGDRQLLSVGPRVTLTDGRYQGAYFSVRPQDAAVSGLPAFDADGGVQSVGANVGYIRQLSSRWGVYSYLKYDRLLGDAASSPIVTVYGSRDQFSGGMALTLTFE